MACADPTDDPHHIRLRGPASSERPSTGPIVALRDYLEQCDSRRITPDRQLFLSTEDRLTRDDIISAVPLCINIIRIGTTLVLPDGEMFGRDDINANLAIKLVLALAMLDTKTPLQGR